MHRNDLHDGMFLIRNLAWINIVHETLIRRPHRWLDGMIQAFSEIWQKFSRTWVGHLKQIRFLTHRSTHFSRLNDSLCRQPNETHPTTSVAPWVKYKHFLCCSGGFECTLKKTICVYQWTEMFSHLYGNVFKGTKLKSLLQLVCLYVCVSSTLGVQL